MRLEVDGDVGTLTLDRPDELNAMSPEMIGELATDRALARRSGAEFRALVVTGAGRAFSAGGDVTWFRRGLDDPDADLVASVRHGADVLHQAIVDFKRIPYPGDRRGQRARGGRRLLAGADVRHPDRLRRRLLRLRLRAHRRLARRGHDLLPPPRDRTVRGSRELMIEDPNLTAADALERGLVSEVVPADELLEVAAAKAAELAAKAPHYIRMVKIARLAEPRQLARRPPAARAARDRRQHGDRGPRERRRPRSSPARRRLRGR